MKRILILSALLVAGCTDYAAQRAAFLNTLVGQPEATLVARLGVPSRSYETGGHKFLAYTDGRTEVIGGPGYWGGGFGYGGYGGFGYGGFGSFAFPTEVVPRVCETTFDLTGGRVQAWALHGNGC